MIIQLGNGNNGVFTWYGGIQINTSSHLFLKQKRHNNKQIIKITVFITID